MSEFSPRIVNALQRSLNVVGGRRLYGIGVTSLALLTGGCAESAYAPNATQKLWEQSWQATYRNPISGELRDIYFRDRTEDKPSLTTCPDTFEVNGPPPQPEWVIVDESCDGFSVIPVEIPSQEEY